MPVIIAGHQRSGTSILQLLCNRHPEIGMTLEFANFIHVGKPYRRYLRDMAFRWKVRANRKDSIVFRPGSKPWQVKVRNHLFFGRYLFLLSLKFRPVIDASTIESVLLSMFPGSKVVGDKYPDYIFQMDKLAHVDGLKSIIIYRDVRDVVSSTLVKVRTDWQGMEFTKKMNTATKVAERWTEAIEIMERNAGSSYMLRYEELVQNPSQELATLGSWLGVSPDGFPAKWLRSNSVGKYEQTLTTEEIDDIMHIAGPTMTRLAYL